MALTHVTALRNSLANAIVDAIDVGTTATEGTLQLTATNDDYTGANLLAEIPMANPAFGAAAAGVATALGVPVEDSSANNTGTAVQFRFIDRDAAEVVKGTVSATGGGGDLEMSSTAITAGDAVRLNSFTYTASL